LARAAGRPGCSPKWARKRAHLQRCPLAAQPRPPAARPHLLLQLHPPDRPGLQHQVQRHGPRGRVHRHQLVPQQPELIKVDDGQVARGVGVRKLKVLSQLGGGAGCRAEGGSRVEVGATGGGGLVGGLIGGGWWEGAGARSSAALKRSVSRLPFGPSEGRARKAAPPARCGRPTCCGTALGAYALKWSMMEMVTLGFQKDTQSAGLASGSDWGGGHGGGGTAEEPQEQGEGPTPRKIGTRGAALVGGLCLAACSGRPAATAWRGGGPTLGVVMGAPSADRRLTPVLFFGGAMWRTRAAEAGGREQGVRDLRGSGPAAPSSAAALADRSACCRRWHRWRAAR
jgi:hypothetical protein